MGRAWVWDHGLCAKAVFAEFDADQLQDFKAEYDKYVKTAAEKLGGEERKPPMWSTPAWANKFMPRMGARSEVYVHRVLRKSCWTARFPVDASSSLPAKFRQKTRTKGWTEGFPEFRALCTVLEWAWGKEKAISGADPPEHVVWFLGLDDSPDGEALQAKLATVVPGAAPGSGPGEPVESASDSDSSSSSSSS